MRTFFSFSYILIFIIEKNKAKVNGKTTRPLFCHSKTQTTNQLNIRKKTIFLNNLFLIKINNNIRFS